MTEVEAQKILLAHVAYVDGRVRDAEIKTAIAMAKECGGFGRLRKSDVVTELKFLLKHRIEDAVEVMLKSRPRVRERLVQLLWVMAICDGELHSTEEELIYQIADDLQVDRATLALQQPQL
ncbi:MAG: TerB family tellurite resistance protein [Henriciella sp.]|nr:TerB family tellurite resistance protein [Henriciella sp.]